MEDDEDVGVVVVVSALWVLDWMVKDVDCDALERRRSADMIIFIVTIEVSSFYWRLCFNVWNNRMAENYIMFEKLLTNEK